MPTSLTAAEIAKSLAGEVIGDGAITLTGFATAEHAKAGDLTFAENEKYFQSAEQSAASAILVAGNFSSTAKVLIRVPNARIAFAKALPLFFPEPRFPGGAHPTAVIAASAQVDSTVHVGPHCVIGENVKIGARSFLHGGNHVGANCVMGANVTLFPNVTLYPQSQIGDRVRIHAGAVIGSDGFGYVLAEGAHLKIPQVGCVIVQDDVEIGANTTIDRGALGPTIIGRGTKIDNLVQIAHNVVTGEHCIVVSHVGIAGSVALGDYVTVAGQSGIAGHLKIGNRAVVAGGSGVTRDVPDGEKWMGYPARPDRRFKRQYFMLEKLPELFRRLKELEKELATIEKSSLSVDNPSTNRRPS